MWPLCSKTTSSASGRPAAIASAAATEQVRSWRPASTSTGWATPAEAVLDRDRAVVLGRGRAQHVGSVDGVAHRGAQVVDAWVARIGEVERELVGEQRGDVLLRARMGLVGPRRLHLLAQLDGLEGGELVLDVREEAGVGDAAGDDRGDRAAREVDRVLQRDERPVGVAQHGVALEPERAGHRLDVGGVVRQSPGLGRRGIRAPGGALVDEQQPAAVAERVEVRAEHRVIEAGPAVEHEERQLAAAALGDVQADVTDVDEHRRTLSSGGMSEQRTQELSGGWLPPAAPDPPAQRRSPFGEPRRPWWRRAGGSLLATLVVIAAKAKTLLLLLPKLKLLTTSATMLVSIAAYALIWGWKFAVGFVALLFIHEMGHVIALRREGVEASAPVFIPFMGAVVWAKSLGGNALAEARVGLAGPILGTIGAAACLPIAAATGSDLWTALAFTGFFLNLFNLLPVTPLDGGRAMAALAPWMWFVGPGRDRRARAHLPQPDHPHHRPRGRVRRLRPLVAPAPRRRGGPRVLRRARARPGAGRARVPRAHRAARGGHGRHPPRAVDPLEQATHPPQTPTPGPAARGCAA